VSFATFEVLGPVEVGQDVEQEVPQVPQGEPVPERVLPVEDGEFGAVDDEVPRAEVVVLEDRRHGWKLRRQPPGRSQRPPRGKDLLLDATALRTQPVGASGGLAADLDDPRGHPAHRLELRPAGRARVEVGDEPGTHGGGLDRGVVAVGVEASDQARGV